MSAQLIKSKLKEAKEAIGDGNLKKAISDCKEVLKEDKDHYMAHLLIAKAYQDSEPSTAATYLKRAVTLTNDPLIPYQGLSKCASPSELPGVFYQLMKLQPDKYEEHYGKIVECGKKSPDPDACLEVLHKLLGELGPDEDDKRNTISISIAEMFLKLKEIPDKWKKPYAESLQRSIKRSHVDQHENYRRCIKLFSELKCNVDLLKVCCEMFASFKNDSYPLEWICKVYTENMKTKEIKNIKDVLAKDIREYVEALYQLNPKSILGLITKGMHHYDSQDYFEALDIFTAVNEIKPNWATCLRMLVQVYGKFRAHRLAEKFYRELNVKDINFLRCLLDNGLKEEALEMIELKLVTVEEEKKGELLYLTIWCKLLMGSEDIEGDLKELQGIDQDWYIKSIILQKSLEGNHKEALDLFSKITSELDSDDLIRRGELEYILQRPAYILSFINALKKDLSNSSAFYWLGKVYYEDKDHLRSIKCIEKCLRMNPLNEAALQILKELSVFSEDNDKLYKEILDIATIHALDLNLYMPLKLLGDYYKDHEDINEAAIYYRKALRLNPRNYDCWLALGGIQMENGSYAAAQKIFEKICQLFPEKSDCALLKIAVIKAKMNLFSESSKAFEEIIARGSASVEVFTEYALAHMAKAEEKKSQRLFGRAKDHIQESVQLLVSAHNFNVHDPEINELIGIALNFAANLPAHLTSLDVPGGIVSDDQPDANVSLRNENLFILANKFFESAVKSTAAPAVEKDHLYYLMAENHFQRFNCWSSALENGLEVLQSAVNCIKIAIGINANRWEYWNLYGLLLSTDEIGEPGVAEEVFTVALDINKTSFTVWANLGTLYLKCNEISAANRAFGKAQECEISYENGWLGQAMIADRLAAEDDAMGLFRHCLDLDYHPLAAMGYAKWVTHRMDQMHVKKYQFAIERMFAIPMCLDAIGWYLQETDVKASVKSLCYLGYLAYHKENYNLAADAYLKATQKAEDEELDDILFNLGYIYLLLDRPEHAVKTFKHIQRISFDAQIGLAVAHFYAKDYKVTYSIYESAIDSLAQTDEERIEILTAMAALMYEFQGAEDATRILMECVNLNNPIKGLLNICALYLLHDDRETAWLVVKELKKYEDNLEYSSDVAFLISEYYMKGNDHKAARNYMLSMIHKFPANPKLRTMYVNLFHRSKQPVSKTHSNIRMAESVLALTQAELLRSNSMELSRVLALISLTNSDIDPQQQKIYAQKALFVNPTSKAAKEALQMCRV